MNPKYGRVAERLKHLIQDGDLLAKDVGTGVQIEDYVALHGWLVRVDNIVRTVFGPASAHFIQLAAMLAAKPVYASEVKGILGILNGALSDWKEAFLPIRNS